MSDKITLKGCPFCDAPPDCVFCTEVENGSGETIEAFIACDICDAQGPTVRTALEAALRWNVAVRVLPPRVLPVELIDPTTV